MDVVGVGEGEYKKPPKVQYIMHGHGYSIRENFLIQDSEHYPLGLLPTVVYRLKEGFLPKDSLEANAPYLVFLL